jgi:hypothetical protein
MLNYVNYCLNLKGNQTKVAFMQSNNLFHKLKIKIKIKIKNWFMMLLFSNLS